MTSNHRETVLNSYDEIANLLREHGQETAAANLEELRTLHETALNLAQQYFTEAHLLTHQLADAGQPTT